ncbi:hypothetical protein Tco_0004166 [Tanacetum coccineum]
MEISIADHIALDDALVASVDRLKIDKCNLRLSSDVSSKEATLQMVYDVLKLTPFYKAFQVTADAPKICMQEFWASAYVHNRFVRDPRDAMHNPYSTQRPEETLFQRTSTEIHSFLLDFSIVVWCAEKWLWALSSSLFTITKIKSGHYYRSFPYASDSYVITSRLVRRVTLNSCKPAHARFKKPYQAHTPNRSCGLLLMLVKNGTTANRSGWSFMQSRSRSPQWWAKVVSKLAKVEVDRDCALVGLIDPQDDQDHYVNFKFKSIAPHPNSLSPEPDNEPIEHTFEQPSSEHQPLSPRQETEIPQSQDPTHPHVAEERTMTVDDLLQLVPKLITKVDSLEKELKQTKLTMGKAIVKLVKKVKKMEAVLKRRHVVLTDSEDEDAENSSKQGRNLQEEGLDEMVRSIMKDKSEDFETPTQGKTSGEADISPEGLEAAETLAKVLTQRTKTYTRKVKTGLRRKLDADEVSTGEGINTGFTDVNTAFEEIKSGDDEVNSGDESIIPSPKKGQREGKAVLEEKSQSKRTKKQIREEQASLAEIVRLQAQEEAENARKAELQRQDALIAKRVQDELELSETQKNRMAQVQEAAKYYTEED